MDLSDLISTALSVAAASSSAYLWVVQNQREAPQLRLHFGRRRPRLAGRYASSRPGHDNCHHEVELIVTNLSTMPDVLVGLRLRLRTREGAWVPTVLTREPHQLNDSYSRLPITLPPRSSARLFLRLGFEMPEGLQPDQFLTSTLQIDGMLVGLGGRKHKTLATAPIE